MNLPHLTAEEAWTIGKRINNIIGKSGTVGSKLKALRKRGKVHGEAGRCAAADEGGSESAPAFSRHHSTIEPIAIAAAAVSAATTPTAAAAANRATVCAHTCGGCSCHAVAEIVRRA